MLPLENDERRAKRDPEIIVWDLLVRTGHWLLVLAFATLYLRYRKFPIHAYAGYLTILIVLVRIVWGLVGSKAARFRTFLYSPMEIISYAVQALRGHAPYYYSHNPMGAAMVFALLGSLLANGIIGILLYSSGQELGPLKDLVPYAWEDTLITTHTLLGHVTAILVLSHIAGVIWAAWLHRENYVMAMLTGYRRIPRSHSHILDDVKTDRKPSRPIAALLRSKTYAWLNFRRPVIGSCLLGGTIIAVYLVVIEYLVHLNKSWVAF